MARQPRKPRQPRSDPERKARMARSMDLQQSRTNRRNRADTRNQESHDRVERLLKQMVDRARGETFERPDALIELEEARMLSLAIRQPMAAVNATLGKCKVMGLLVEKHAVGRPGEFTSLQGDVEELEERVMENLRERIGSAGADAFMKVVADMRKAYRGDDDDGNGGGDIIDGEATEVK